MTIQLNTKARIVRETTAKFEVPGEEGRIEEIRVRYYSPTVVETRKALSDIDAARKRGEATWLSDTLATQIESLPDLVDAKGKQFKITAEFLENLSVPNLMAIDEAIQKDLVPKSPAA